LFNSFKLTAKIMAEQNIDNTAADIVEDSAAAAAAAADDFGGNVELISKFNLERAS
jgi:hypothetical protein